MATALWPLHTALYAKLTGSTSLMALVTGVFDDVPTGTDYPYVTVGAFIETEDDAHDRQGLETVVSVHVWSKSEGFKEAALIFAAVDAVLDRQPLSVDGFTDVAIWHDMHQEIRDPDPYLRHIAAQYRVRLTRDT